MQYRMPDNYDMLTYYLLRFLSFCLRHWPIVAGGAAGCITGMIFKPGPAVVMVLVAFGATAGYFFLLAYRRSCPEQQAQPTRSAQEQVYDGVRERWEYSSTGARQGWTRDTLGRQVQVTLPACAEYHRLQKDPGAFDRVIGLERAKESLTDAFTLILQQSEEAKRLKKYGVKPPKGILLFGPPGTGKTSFARAAAQTFGCGFIVVNASSVAGAFVGQTEENIRQIFRFARANAPCVIFWDEIDAVAKKRGAAAPNSPSDLAINTILTEMDGFAGSEGIVVIAATNRIDQLDDALLRPGRFDVKVEVGLPEEKAREKLFELFLKGRPHNLKPDDLHKLALETEGLSPAEIQAVINEAARQAAKKTAPVTAALIREALREQAGRGRQAKARPVEEVWAEINSLIGLAPVKEFLKEVEAVAKANVARREKGLPLLKQSLHMCFLGNPGTGKTTVARLVGELLAAVGALPSGHLVETDRSGLVAQYVGQTAQKVQEMVKKALGGVLFIDEAYSLARGGPNDFGAEALDTLIKVTEDHRDKLVVILAGYTSEMQALFAMNPGLESRIAFTCEFPDYKPEELLEIARLEAKKQGFSLAPEAESALLAHFRQTDTSNLGNGRYARKVIEAAVRRAVLSGRDGEIKPEDLT